MFLLIFNIFFFILGEDPCDMIHNVPEKCKKRPKLQRPKPGKIFIFIQTKMCSVSWRL